MACIKVNVNGLPRWRESADEDVERCMNPHCKRERWNARLGRRRPMFSYDETMWAFCNVSCFGQFWEGILRKHGPDFEQFIKKLALDGDIPVHVMRHPDYFKDLYAEAVRLANSGQYTRDGVRKLRRLPSAAA